MTSTVPRPHKIFHAAVHFMRCPAHRQSGLTQLWQAIFCLPWHVLQLEAACHVGMGLQYWEKLHLGVRAGANLAGRATSIEESDRNLRASFRLCSSSNFCPRRRLAERGDLQARTDKPYAQGTALERQRPTAQETAIPLPHSQSGAHCASSKHLKYSPGFLNG